MWNKIRLLILLVTLATINCDKSCPTECICDYQKAFAECHSLPSTHFAATILKLLIIGNGEAEMTLESDTFSTLKLNDLNTISIQKINIKSIHPHSFQTLANLENVQIIDAGLTRMDYNIFNHNRKLFAVNLSNNPLKETSAYLLNSSYIQELALKNCNINSPSNTTFSLMPSLTFIDLTNNRIENLDPDTFIKLTLIQEIDLSDNLLTKIYGNLFSLEDEEMDSLKLNGNPLTTTDGLIISYLDTLKISNCKIRSITQTMFQGINDLSQLTLSSNEIYNIHPNSFENFENLRYIDLSKNDLSVIPKRIFYNSPLIINIKLGENPYLKKLPEGGFSSKIEYFKTTSFNISHCGLQSLEAHDFLTMILLEELYLHNNVLKEIDENAFSPMIHLKILDLSNNKISKLSENLFKINLDLQKLNLAGNPLKVFSMVPFKTSPNLLWMDISNTQLTNLWEIPQESGDFLRNLNFLNVSFNKITNINITQLTILKSLNILDITYNPLECTEQLANLITWLGNNKVVPAASPTHMDISFSDRKRYFSLRKKEQWEELAKTRCQVISVQTSSNTENTIENEVDENDDDEKIIDNENENWNYRNTDDYKEYNDDYNKDIENNDNSESIQIFIEDETPKTEAKIIPITIGTYISVWTATMITVATISLVSILLILHLIKRYQPRRNIDELVKKSIIKKNCNLVYKPLSEDVTEPNTPVLKRIINSCTSNNGFYKTIATPENV